MLLEVGNIVEGKVSGITNFGAFVQLPEGKTGLVHISEVSEEYVKDINTHLKESQTVKVKIISMDNNGKIALSIKKAMAPKPRVRSSRPADFDFGRNSNDSMSFEDRLSKFLKDSDERMQDLKKNAESKRRSGGPRKSMQFY